ncbi:MAG: phosphoribosylamine--glycine ligase [Gammaproteobacteria bacterium]|nr:phosphoribosylamine--glycine ligase [Gammaproteobacteria bacterium]
MNILIIGNGGREHALAWKAAQSRRAEKVYVAPGNAGTAMEPGIENIAIDSGDTGALVTFALDHQVDLTIVGPEVPLAAGVVDHFTDRGLACFGPTAAAAQLEGSKAFAKDFMARHGIPTAAYGVFTETEAATRFIRQTGAPIVVKADGLAAGKGVIIAHSVDDAEQAVHDMLAGNRFGDAGHRVVIEEFLEGEEASFICVCDGQRALALATSQDHKAVGEGDTGPNTGGMGAYSPAPVVDESMYQRVMREVIEPTVSGMAADGAPFTGFLYAGLMISPSGKVKVLEFNVRFGDPETQPVLMRLKSDLVELCLAAIAGELDQHHAEWDPRAALGVVLAAKGYPDSYESGQVISGLDTPLPGHVKVFHAGTAIRDGQTVTAGGRVLCVTALGETVNEAQQEAYRAAAVIDWTGKYYRHDIGHRAIDRP